MKPGRALIATRVFDHFGGGGFSGVVPDLWLAPADASATPIPLAGPWQYKVERSLAPANPDFGTQPRAPSPDNPNSPTVLYGAMIAPLTPFAIRGAIWYQGESNAAARVPVPHALPRADPRLAARVGPAATSRSCSCSSRTTSSAPSEPGDSTWAELREAQALTLALPNTGMAVAIDIGEADDIHPRNKQDVGARLARWALADTYGKPVVKSGPLYVAATPRGRGHAGPLRSTRPASRPRRQAGARLRDRRSGSPLALGRRAHRGRRRRRVLDRR